MLHASASQEIPSAVIRVDGLHSGYAGRPVLKGVSFTILKGEFVGILGPNGSGKTTLLQTLSGIVPSTAGRVEILGCPLEKLKARDRALRMAVVAQNAEVRFPFSCREVVMMGRYPHQRRWQVDSRQDEEVVGRVLRITDTEKLSDRSITAISGGEMQRVHMAKALAQETDILILDEATSSMDVHRKFHAFQILEKLNREEGVTVLTVLHDVNLAALFCRRFIFVKDGQIVADGPPDSVLTPEILEDVYRTRVLVQNLTESGKRQVIFLPV